jgi:branched-chain amino acid transport system substrate-binding protein
MNADKQARRRQHGRRRARHGLALATGVVSAALALTACAGSGSSGSGTTGTSGGSKAPFVIAVLGDNSGSLAEQFGPGQYGAEAYADVINAAGGVDGHQIVIKNYDDAGSPQTTLANARAAIEAGAVAIAGSEPFLSSAEPYLGGLGMPVAGVPFDPTYFKYNSFFSLIGDDFSTSPSSTATETYLIRDQHAQKIAVVSNNVASTAAESQSSAKVAEKLGADVVYQNYNVDQTSTASLLSLAQAIKSAGAQAVIGNLFATEAPTLQVDLSNIGSQAKVVEGILIEDNYPQQFGSAVAGLSFEYTQAPPYATGIPAIKTYLNEMNAKFKSYTYSAIALTSYDSVAFLVHGMQMAAAKGLPVTPKNIAAQLNTLKNDTIGGLTAPMTYPLMRTQPSPCLAFVQIRDGKWTQSSGTPSNPFLCTSIASL